MRITFGLEFTCINFSARCKVSAIRNNEVDVIITPSDGNAWEEKNWNLQELKAGFESGKYKEAEKNDYPVSVY